MLKDVEKNQAAQRKQEKPTLRRRLEQAGFANAHMLNMTDMAIHFSRYVNGVAMRHGEVSQNMFPQFPIHAITNGVHAGTWASESIQELFDREIPEWRRDNAYMRYAVGIPTEDIRKAHALAKAALIKEVRKRCGVQLDDRAVESHLAVSRPDSDSVCRESASERCGRKSVDSARDSSRCRAE